MDTFVQFYLPYLAPELYPQLTFSLTEIIKNIARNSNNQELVWIRSSPFLKSIDP